MRDVNVLLSFSGFLLSLASTMLNGVLSKILSNGSLHLYFSHYVCLSFHPYYSVLQPQLFIMLAPEAGTIESFCLMEIGVTISTLVCISFHLFYTLEHFILLAPEALSSSCHSYHSILFIAISKVMSVRLVSVRYT